MSYQVLLRSLAIGAILAASHLAPSAAGAVQVTAFKQAVAEAVARDDEVAEIYRSRGFAPIWTGDSEEDRARRAALLEAFASARQHGLPERDYDPRTILARMSAVSTGRDRGAMEVELSRLFLQYARDLQTGVIDTPRRVDSGIVRQIPRRDASYYFDGILNGDPRAFLARLAPRSQEYARLMKEKMRLERIVAHGGWGPQVTASKLEPGDSGPQLVALRDRLTKMGYLARTVTGSYDRAMEEAVRRFQEAHGLEVDGVAGGATLAEINTRAIDRLKSVVVAMERERWINMPDGLGKRHVKVNLTDFRARLYDDDKLTFETRSVVGHQDPDRRTPEFSDVMTHMVINPSWYVPRSIIVNEYLPKLRRNPGAVSHLQITDSRGRVVGRGRSFAGYTASTFPFSMRQPPGPRNALGTVKFMFPNKYNIYLHDTPAKSLFSRNVRTFSHGCVRLNDPHEFAYALLAAQTDDPQGKFHSILRSGAETRVDLETPVQVHLIYRTAFTTAKGRTEYRRDVYGRDGRVWNALSAAGVEVGGIRS